MGQLLTSRTTPSPAHARGGIEFEKKSAQLNLRVPKLLLDAVKARAQVRGIPYTQLIRETLEHALTTREL